MAPPAAVARRARRAERAKRHRQPAAGSVGISRAEPVAGFPNAMSWMKLRNQQAEAGKASASAKRQQQFLTNAFVHVFEFQRILALVAQDFEHRRPPLLGNLDPRIVQVHDVHLERLHKKILVVPATGAGQCHERLLFCRQQLLPNER